MLDDWWHGQTRHQDTQSEPQPPQPPQDVSTQELPFHVACCETLAVGMNVDGAGAAKRRRVRRLRSRWRHMSIACALAEALHHSSGCPVYDRRVVEDAKHGAVRGQMTATRVREATGHAVFTFDDEGKPVAGERFRPMVKDLRRIPVHVEEPSLDVPALQMVEQPVEVDTFFRLCLPAVVEQVIEVPKLALPVCAVQRAALSEPQLVEQLVEVRTVLSYSLLQQQTAEQIIDFPVPGRGGGARGGLQGLPQGQGSTASAGEQTIVDDRPEDRVPQRLPLSRLLLLLLVEVLAVFSQVRPQQLLVPSRLPTFLVVFSPNRFQRRFLELNMVMMLMVMELCTVHAQVESLVEVVMALSQDRVQQLVVWMLLCRIPPKGSSSLTATLASLTTGTDGLSVLSGNRRLASRWCGSARRLRGEGSGTGTRKRVPVRMTSLLCLLSEAFRGEGLGIPSPHPGCHCAVVVPLSVVLVLMVLVMLLVPCVVDFGCIRMAGLLVTLHFVLYSWSLWSLRPWYLGC